MLLKIISYQDDVNQNKVQSSLEIEDADFLRALKILIFSLAKASYDGRSKLEEEKPYFKLIRKFKENLRSKKFFVYPLLDTSDNLKPEKTLWLQFNKIGFSLGSIHVKRIISHNEWKK